MSTTGVGGDGTGRAGTGRAGRGPAIPGTGRIERAEGTAVGGTGTVVFDVDGVVADVRHRLHHLAGRSRDWAGFFAEAGADPPLVEGVTLARSLAVEHEVVWLTGRPEQLRAVTLGWLSGHLCPAGRLVMRPDGDHRPARRFKREALRRLRRTDRVVLVVDDDPDVVDMVEQEGLTARLADWVPRTPLLHVAQERDGRT